MKLMKENKSLIYFNGAVFSTNKCGNIFIIGKAKTNSGEIYYHVKFDDGTSLFSKSSAISSGRVKNPMCPSVLGIGYIGVGNNLTSINSVETREYNIWFSMINRCYSNKVHTIRPTYKDCTVDTRWHNFQNFCEDIKTLDSYILWLNPKNKMQLDKDIKIRGNKVYSKNTCMFVSMETNSKFTSLSNHSYIGINNITKEEISFTNMSDFSKEHNLHRSVISQCISGKYKQTGGWSFKKIF